MDFISQVNLICSLNIRAAPRNSAKILSETSCRIARCCLNLFAACGRETLRGFLSRWKARVKLACAFVYCEFENHRYLPVILLSQFRISAGVPAATICPPASPPPGPISIT